MGLKGNGARAGTLENASGFIINGKVLHRASRKRVQGKGMVIDVTDWEPTGEMCVE